MRLLYILSIGVFSLFVFGVSAAAQAQEDGAHFFSSVQDIPLMPGLVELADQTLTFDKPQGRIIESVALIDSVQGGDVLAYYRDVLPQFGWQSVGEAYYVRDQEHLHLRIEDFENEKYLRILLQPASDDSH